MKRFIFSITAVIISFSLYALDAHLKFKGIPIDGNYKEFAQELIQKDFKQIEATNDGIVLKGNFMATPGVMVLCLPRSYQQGGFRRFCHDRSWRQLADY